MSKPFTIYAGGRGTIRGAYSENQLQPDSFSSYQEAVAYCLGLLGPLGHANWCVVLGAKEDHLLWRDENTGEFWEERIDR